MKSNIYCYAEWLRPTDKINYILDDHWLRDSTQKITCLSWKAAKRFPHNMSYRQKDILMTSLLTKQIKDIVSFYKERFIIINPSLTNGFGC